MDIYGYCNGFRFHSSRLKLPFPDCVRGFLVETIAETFFDYYILYKTIFPDHNGHDDGTLYAVVPGFVTVFRIRCVDGLGRDVRTLVFVLCCLCADMVDLVGWRNEVLCRTNRNEQSDPCYCKHKSEHGGRKCTLECEGAQLK